MRCCCWNKGQTAGCPNVAHEEKNREEKEEKLSFVTGTLEASVWEARVDRTVEESVRAKNRWIRDMGEKEA